MPKIFNTNILVILLAAFLFFMVGWLWYGVLFMEKWMALQGIEAAPEGVQATPMLIGFVISLLQATGLAGIMKMTGKHGLQTGLKVGAMSWLFFALPVTAYAWNYANAPTDLLKIDGSHLLVGYLVMGVVYGLLRKPE
jgi:hypothetical protein